jgi:hypothetical protein
MRKIIIAMLMIVFVSLMSMSSLALTGNLPDGTEVNYDKNKNLWVDKESNPLKVGQIVKIRDKYYVIRTEGKTHKDFVFGEEADAKKASEELLKKKPPTKPEEKPAEEEKPKEETPSPERDADCEILGNICTVTTTTKEKGKPAKETKSYYYREGDKYYEIPAEEYEGAKDYKIDEDGNLVYEDKYGTKFIVEPLTQEQINTNEDIKNDLSRIDVESRLWNNLINRYAYTGIDLAKTGGDLWGMLNWFTGGKLTNWWDSFWFTDWMAESPHAAWLTGDWGRAVCAYTLDLEEAGGGAGIAAPGSGFPSIWVRASRVHLEYINKTTGEPIDEYMYKLEYELSAAAIEDGHCVEFDLIFKNSDKDKVDVDGDGKSDNRDNYYDCDESVSKAGDYGLYKKYFDRPKDNEKFCIRFIDRGHLTTQTKELMDFYDVSNDLCTTVVDDGTVDESLECGWCFMARMGGGSGRGPSTSEDSRIPDAPNDYP